jgi:hypothetical protein
LWVCVNWNASNPRRGGNTSPGPSEGTQSEKILNETKRFVLLELF